MPLTFLIGDILRTMAINQKNYFKLNKENSKDGRDYYLYFTFELSNKDVGVRNFVYSR